MSLDIHEKSPSIRQHFLSICLNQFPPVHILILWNATIIVRADVGTLLGVWGRSKSNLSFLVTKELADGIGIAAVSTQNPMFAFVLAWNFPKLACRRSPLGLEHLANVGGCFFGNSFL